MGINKRLINTGSATPAPLDPLANFETVTYTGTGSQAGDTQKINGYIRKGAAFNGSSSVISIPLSIVSVASAYSVSLWFNAVNVGINTGIFTNQGSSAISGQIAINLISSTQINVASIVNNGSNTVDAIAATVPTMSANNWNHLVVIGNRSLSNKVKLYLNGTEASNYSFNAGAGSNTLYSTAQIGRSDNRFFNGKLDQIRFFNSSITQANINSLKNETYASATKSTTDIFGNGSGVALYEMEDNSLSSNFGQAAVFNGSSSRIEANNSALSSNTVRTYSTWFKKTGSSEGYVLANRNASNYGAHIHVSSGNVLQGWVWNNANSNYYFNLSSGGAVTLGKWHHAVLTWGANASDCKIYLDGVLKQTASSLGGSIPSSNAPNNLNIGHYFRTVYFAGSIDNVRLFNATLAQADVTKLYKESSQIPTTNLVAHYTLNGNAIDSKGGHNGTETSITYSGGVYSGTDTAINYLGMAFSPSLVWVKQRSGSASHTIQDSIRGGGQQKNLYSDNTATEGTYGGFGFISSFDSNGFTVQKGAGNHTNTNGQTYVAWCWRSANSTTTISANSVGNSIASNVRANQESGFSTVQYQGNQQNATIAHGLSSAPEMMIIKSTTVAQNWAVYHKDITNQYWLQLNTTVAKLGSAPFNGTNPTNNVFSIGSGGVINTNNSTNIAYLFHSVSGYQLVGKYTGISSGNVVVDCGFKPRWIMLKNTNGSGNWEMLDAIRSPSLYSNPGAGSRLRANSGSLEATFSNSPIKFTDSGFFLDGSVTSNGYVDYDKNGDTFIFLAIA